MTMTIDMINVSITIVIAIGIGRNAFQETTFPKRSFPQVAVITAKNHKRQRRKRQSVTAKREKSQTPKVLTAILILQPNLN